MTVYVAVHVVVAPGASVVAGQLTEPAFASEITSAVIVTLPVFWTTKRYGMVAPAVLLEGTPACLSRVIFGADATGVSTVSDAVVVPPVGDVPDAVAVFATWPESTSTWVSVYVAVQVVDAFGARVATGHETVPTLRSLTLTACSVTLPVLATRNVYGIVEPAVLPVAVPACLSTAIAGRDGIGRVTVSVAVAAAPLGGFAETLAELTTCPASTSA